MIVGRVLERLLEVIADFDVDCTVLPRSLLRGLFAAFSSARRPVALRLTLLRGEVSAARNAFDVHRFHVAHGQVLRWRSDGCLETASHSAAISALAMRLDGPFEFRRGEPEDHR